VNGKKILLRQSHVTLKEIHFKMNKIILSIVLFMFCCSINNAQSIKTKLYAKAIPCDTLKYFCFNYTSIDVIQELEFSNYAFDTVLMKLESCSPMQITLCNLFYQNMKLTYFDKKEEISIKYTFDGVNISFILPKPTCNLKLTYQYTNDYFLRDDNKATYIIPVGVSSNSWYFTCDNMDVIYAEVKTMLSDDFYLLMDRTKDIQKNKFIFDILKFNKNEPISFVLLEKDYFHPISFNVNNARVNLFIFKGQNKIMQDEKSDNFKISPGDRVNEQLISQYITNVKSYLDLLDSIIFPLEEREVNIYEAVLEMEINESVFTWGVPFIDYRTHIYGLLLDTSAILNNQIMLHELIHHYTNRILPPKGDSARLFFQESLTEYLAVCLKYPNAHQRDSIFNQKIIETCLSGNGSYSILKHLTDDGSFGQYTRTPFMIHAFANILGENKFLSVLSEFYKEAFKKGAMSFELLEKICKQNGITDKQWNLFKKTL
jgi:hypothetical protein